MQDYNFKKSYEQGVERGYKLFPYTFTLTLVLLILKATGYLKIGWWLVFLPMYGGMALLAAILLIFLAIALLIFILSLIFE